MRGLLTTAVIVLWGCSASTSGGSVAPDTGAAKGEDASLDAVAAKDSALGPEDTHEVSTTVAEPILAMPICGTPSCFGSAEISATCKSSGDWFAFATAKCKEKGLEVVYLEFGGACTGGTKSVRYACCPSGTPTATIAASSADCPASAEGITAGSNCGHSTLYCHFANPCGHDDEWHCKGGLWQPNSSCGCFPE